MANSASDADTLQWLTSAQPRLACPQCNSIGTINTIRETPTSRAFALCANSACNGRFELERFAPTVPTPSASDIAIQELQATMKLIQAKYQGLEDVVRKLQLAEEKNAALNSEVAALNSENAALKEELKKVTRQQPLIGNKNNNNNNNQNRTRVPVRRQVPTPTAVQNPSPATVPRPLTWAERTSTHLPPTASIRSERRMAAAARAFQAIHGPQGYEYIYITRNRRMDRPDVRRRLRRVGIETYRVMDIAFPTKNVIGILVHVQYKTSVLEILAKAKIDLVADFDPTDPKHIFDPKHDSLSASDRVQLALSIHHTRCIRALKYMRSQVATAVARTFLEAGWITESDVPRPRYIDLDDPTDAFRQSDADGEHDSMSDCSDIQDQ